MKKTCIKNIKEKEHVAGAFLVTKKEMGLSKSGKPYINMRIMDSTGELEARVWEDAEELGKNFRKDDVAAVKGFAVAYQGGLQVNISSVTALSDTEYSIRDFLPASAKDPVKMMAELDRIISGMKDERLKGLLTAIFKDPDIRSRFEVAPAAKAMHHSYLSGLLEHVLSICGLAEKIADHYGRRINKDLLLSGAILHDIGKIYELSYRRSFDYTDEGRLIGHITIGVEMIDEKVRALKDFPKDLSVLLKHMILSHHGQLEFGSPKRPKTIEAIILSYLDDMDAKVSTVQSLIEASAEGSSWTPYQRLFERYIYTGGVKPPGESVKTESEENKDEDDDDDKSGSLSLFR
ncbi:MAG: HD domain-containing protein [Deltaproteobacteria bacterium]|nr:HD domain-containing protein [Deltaproteobacteria bacterium]